MFHPTKRTSLRVRTSGSEKHYPFQVEIANKNAILCHVGRVYDPDSIENNGTSPQTSWPANLNKISQRGLQKAQRYNKVELAYYSYQVQTNSARIYYKGGVNGASRGRASLSDTTSVGENGYVSWPRSGPTHEYIILHPIEEDNVKKWFISAVEAGDIEKDDIVIAYINNGTTVRQIWKSDVSAIGGVVTGGDGNNDQTGYHPFQIVRNENPQVETFSVMEGTVNNQVAGLASHGLGNVEVWLQTYPSPSISVGSGGSTSETEAWLRVGRIVHVPNVPPDGTYKTTIHQYLRNSLWLERFKCGDDTAQYWYSQI
jgi:hypothetical protein